MKNLNAESFERFERVPQSALTELTPPDNILSDSEAIETGKHTETGTMPSVSDTATAQPSSPQGMKLGNTVSGKFVVDMTDVIMPALTVWVVSLMGYGFEKKQLLLTAKEKETLTPLVQAYLDSVNVNFNNPFNNLLFGLAMVYGAKIIDVIPALQRKENGMRQVKQTTAGKVAELIKKQKSTEGIIEEISKRRKKGTKDAIEYFNANKSKFGKENEPDINLP